MTQVAVITGDIVRSSALSATTLDAVMTTLADTTTTIASWSDAPAPVFERYRGDGWQLCLFAPRFALRAALHLRATLSGAHDDVQTRQGIALGTATLAGQLSASSGPVFEASGRALEALGVHALWRFGGGLAEAPRDELVRGLFAVCDALSRGWTQRQAQIVARLGVANAPSMTTLAESLGVSAQTVQTHFDRASGHALCQGMECFETAVDEITTEND